MPYKGSLKGDFGPPLYEYIEGVKTFVSPESSYLLNGKYAYSFRTGHHDQNARLLLGEKRMPKSLKSAGGLLPYLDAEKTAIRELNGELENSSLLGEGTWGRKDAGHVFATCHQQREIGEYTYTTSSSSRVNGKSFALHSPFVDPITYALLDPISFKMPGSGRNTGPSIKPGSLSKADLIAEVAAATLDSSPDVITGGIGETLVDLVRLPELLKRSYDLALKFRDAERIWRRLSETIKKDVDRAFKDPLYSPSRLSSESSSAYLYWSFVLLPLIGDLKLLLKAAAYTSGSIQTSTKRVRKVEVPRTFVADWTAAPAVVPYRGTTSLGYGYGNGIYPSRTSSSYVIEYDVLIHSKWRRIVGYDNAFLAKADEYNKILGVWYPSLLWDLVPWSFVIDWLIHIGNSIDRAHVLTNGKYQLDYSWATVRGHSGVFIDDVTPFFSVKEKISFSGVKPAITTFQSRFPVDPTRGLKPKWSSLSGTQRLTAAALGFSRLK